MKNEKELLWMANTKAGRYLLGINDADRIVKLSPNSYHQLRDFKNGKVIIQGAFFTTNKISDTLLPIITKLEIAEEYKHIEKPYDAFLHYAGLERSTEYPHIYLANFTPAIGAGSGRIYSLGTWVQVQAGSGVVVTGVDFHYIAVQLSGGTYGANRDWIQVDTSTIGAGSTIASGYIRTYAEGTAKADTYTDTVDVCACSPAATNALATTDFVLISRTVFSSTAISALDFTAGHTNDFALNAGGLANISKTGWSKFLLMTEKDRADSIPGGDGISEYRFYGTTPYLSVTWTLPVTTNYLKKYRRLSFQ